jgi:hypothetical protein
MTEEVTFDFCFSQHYMCFFKEICKTKGLTFFTLENTEFPLMSSPKNCSH